jgi:FAD/FMN-containing dehydrogenase
MDLRDPKERAKILPVLDEYTRLVVAHGGTVSAEHNDGILRTPYLPQVFGPEIAALFKEVKEIFDPLNIFNPGKKVGGTKEYLEAHIAPRA